MPEKTPQKQQDIYNLYRVVFDSPEGNKVLFHLMKKCHVFSPSFVGDPYQTAFNEGQRHVVTSIMKTLKVDQQAMLKTMESFNEKQ